MTMTPLYEMTNVVPLEDYEDSEERALKWLLEDLVFNRTYHQSMRIMSNRDQELNKKEIEYAKGKLLDAIAKDLVANLASYVEFEISDNQNLNYGIPELRVNAKLHIGIVKDTQRLKEELIDMFKGMKGEYEDL